MTDEPLPDELLRLITARNATKAQRLELATRVRRGELVARDHLEYETIRAAHAVRDRLLVMSHRHAALLAAGNGLAPAMLAAALDRVVREALSEIAAGPQATPP